MTACRNLNRFDTREGGAFCGDLVSGPSFHEGFIPKGEPSVLRVRLTLDTSQISSFSDVTQHADDDAAPVTPIPGRLTSADKAAGLCSGSGQALFENAPVRAIPQVDHDQISTLTFGEGHDEDFFAYVDSTCQGTMLAVVSLLRNGDVELRLFKPAALPAPGAGPDKRPGFALFYLRRNDSGCGF